MEKLCTEKQDKLEYFYDIAEMYAMSHHPLHTHTSMKCDMTFSYCLSMPFNKITPMSIAKSCNKQHCNSLNGIFDVDACAVTYGVSKTLFIAMPRAITMKSQMVYDHCTARRTSGV